MNDLTPTAPPFGRLLNYRLWRLLSLSSAPVLRLCEGRFGITRREWAMLAMLAQDAASMTPAQIAELAGIDRAQVSRTCEKLEAKQLVDRVKVRGDARRVRIRLTDKGRALYDEIAGQVSEINAHLVSVLDEATARVFDDALQQLTERAAQVNREMVVDVRVDRSRAASRARR